MVPLHLVGARRRLVRRRLLLFLRVLPLRVDRDGLKGICGLGWLLVL